MNEEWLACWLTILSFRTAVPDLNVLEHLAVSGLQLDAQVLHRAFVHADKHGVVEHSECARRVARVFGERQAADRAAHVAVFGGHFVQLHVGQDGGCNFTFFQALPVSTVECNFAEHGLKVPINLVLPGVFMHKRTVQVPAAKPRNPIIQAAVLGLVKLGVVRHRPGKAPARGNLQGRELDQVVRECGEW